MGREIHYIILILSFITISRSFRGQFSVSELFMFCSVNAYFLTFIFRQSYSDKDIRLNNMIVFIPWVYFNITGLIGYISNIIIPFSSAKTKYISSMLIAAIILGGYLFVNISTITLMGFINDVVIKDLFLLCYMIFFIPLGLFAINEIRHMYPLFVFRKFYHGLTFIILFPGCQYSLHESPALTVFFINIVTVALIFFEVYRFLGCTSPAVASYFRLISLGRER